jgi:hypothetical protein
MDKFIEKCRSIGGIIKSGSARRERYGIIRTAAQASRNRISRENRQEYDNEKRAIEIANRMPCGHRDAKAVAISKMMLIPENHAKRILSKKDSKVVLDGKID